jgi:HSP20 family protein
MLARVIPQNGGLDRSWSSSVPTVENLVGEALSALGHPIFEDRAILNWSGGTFAPSADVIETQDQIQVSIDLPGHDPKSLQARVEGDKLTIQGERRQRSAEKGASYLLSERGYGRYTRSFALPRTVDGNKCEAHYEHGVLTLTLPKREESKSRVIDIQVHS